MTASARFDAIVVGGGHNGLVAAAYLCRAGLKTLVIEANPRLGGPAATLEFMPGYFTTIANSPGSLEPKIVSDLELAGVALDADTVRKWLKQAADLLPREQTE